MSEEDYENLMETLELLSIPGFRASMKRSVAQMKRGAHAFAGRRAGRSDVKPFAVRFTREAAKDVKKLSPRLKRKLREILTVDVAAAPFSGKKLVGDLSGFYSVRLTHKDRIVYSVDAATHTIFVHRARTHYGQ